MRIEIDKRVSGSKLREAEAGRETAPGWRPACTRSSRRSLGAFRRGSGPRAGDRLAGGESSRRQQPMLSRTAGRWRANLGDDGIDLACKTHQTLQRSESATAIGTLSADREGNRAQEMGSKLIRRFHARRGRSTRTKVEGASPACAGIISLRAGRGGRMTADPDSPEAGERHRNGLGHAELGHTDGRKLLRADATPVRVTSTRSWETGAASGRASIANDVPPSGRQGCLPARTECLRGRHSANHTNSGRRGRGRRIPARASRPDHRGGEGVMNLRLPAGEDQPAAAGGGVDRAARVTEGRSRHRVQES